jgi:hypothetical protein
MVILMTSFRSFGPWICAACIAMIGGAGALAAEDASPAARPDAVLAPFLTADAFAVGYVDLSAIDPVAIADELTSLAGCPEADRQEVRSRAQVAKATLEGVRATGIRRVYAVVGLGDVSTLSGPLVVVQTAEPKDLDAAEGAISAILLIPNQTAKSPRTMLQVKRHPSGALLVGYQLTLDRYQSLTAVRRPDLTEPLAQMAEDGAAAAIVFNPSPDFRRVVRELWPPMPDWLPQLKPLTGQFLADRFRYDELAVYAPPQMSIRWAAQMADPDAAEVVAQMIRDLPAVIDRAADEEDVPDDVRSLVAPISKLLIPKVDGARTTLRLDIHDPDFTILWKPGAMLHNKMINARYRSQHMDAFEQLALAVLKYEDKNRHYPASAAICDADGRPLLSWRVAILPYLEEKSLANLYNEFHLDEPWDSPHNRELVKKMPAVFADPGHPELTKEGKTVYLVPVGPGTVFDTTEGTTIRDITDGTSKTIMIVSAAPDRAVEWTRPEDWTVDLEQPLDGLKAPGRDKFVAANCDGWVHALPTDIDPAVLRAMLTRAGGEVVDRP